MGIVHTLFITVSALVKYIEFQEKSNYTEPRDMYVHFSSKDALI
jgi:hypothetical protein